MKHNKGHWRKLLCVGLLFTFYLSPFTSLHSQNLWERFTDWLIRPRNVDSTYIYQQNLGFSPSLTSNFSQQRVQMTTTIDIEDFLVMDENYNPVLDENGDEMVIDMTVMAIDKMQEGISRRAGVMLGFGRLGAGWSFELAPDSSQKSSTFLFSFRGNKWGLNINYLGFSQKVTEEFYSVPSTPLFTPDTSEFATGNRVKRLTVDGYYVFNTRRFAYPPGIAGNMVQLRSAGSWMLAGRYLQSDLNLNNAFARFGMSQLSLGCGYSYTWVPFSRAPRYSNNQASNHFTFFINGTVIPMLTVFNYLTVEPDSGFENLISTEKRGSFCWPTPNILFNATIGLSWSKFYLGAQFNYNVFHFNTRNAINTSGPLQEAGLETMGVLYEWNLGLKFQACF